MYTGFIESVTICYCQARRSCVVLCPCPQRPQSHCWGKG